MNLGASVTKMERWDWVYLPYHLFHVMCCLDELGPKVNEINAESHISKQQCSCIIGLMLKDRSGELGKWEKAYGNETRPIRAEISWISVVR